MIRRVRGAISGRQGLDWPAGRCAGAGRRGRPRGGWGSREAVTAPATRRPGAPAQRESVRTQKNEPLALKKGSEKQHRRKLPRLSAIGELNAKTDLFCFLVVFLL